MQIKRTSNEFFFHWNPELELNLNENQSASFVNAEMQCLSGHNKANLLHHKENLINNNEMMDDNKMIYESIYVDRLVHLVSMFIQFDPVPASSGQFSNRVTKCHWFFS